MPATAKTRTNSAYAYHYTPIPIAQKFHNAINSGLYKILLLVCGARSGKTKATIGGQLLLDAFWQPGYYERDIRDREPYRILVCEPTFKMVKLIAWNLVRKGLDPSRIVSINETDRIIQYQGVYGITEIIFASYEQGASKIEGLAIYRAYLDECFQCPHSFYSEVLVRLSDRRGKLIMVGTPKPVAWIQDELIGKANLPGSKIFYISWWTKHNPFFPKDDLYLLKTLLPPKLYKRNYEASLDGFEGQIYESFDKSVHAQIFDINKDNYRYIWASMDWGWTHNASFHVFGLRDDDEVDILHEVSRACVPIVPVGDNRDCWGEIMRGFQEMYKDKFDFVFAGPDRPENISAISDLGVYIKAADDSVMEGIQFVSALMQIDERGKSKLRIHAENCPMLVKRIPMLRWAEDKDGNPTEKQLKKDDDECDSMRYGLFSMRKWFRLSHILSAKKGESE